LGKIIIGADFKSYDAINILAARSKEEHRNPRAIADAPQHIETIQAGKHDIEHDQKVIAREGTSEAGFPIMNGFHLKALRTEIFAYQRAELNIIIDDQNPFHVIHFNSSTHNAQ